MKYQIMIMILAVALLIAGCSSSEPTTIDADDDGNEEVEVMEETVKVDTDDDGQADVMVKQDEEVTEVTLDLEEVKVDGEWCVPGTTYNYESDEGTVDSIVIGMDEYEGSPFCKAQTSNTISSPAGDIVSDSTYYFNEGHNEFWVITSVSGAMMPTPQVTTTHILDGEVQ